MATTGRSVRDWPVSTDVSLRGDRQTNAPVRTKGVRHRQGHPKASAHNGVTDLGAAADRQLQLRSIAVRPPSTEMSRFRFYRHPARVRNVDEEVTAFASSCDVDARFLITKYLVNSWMVYSTTDGKLDGLSPQDLC